MTRAYKATGRLGPGLDSPAPCRIEGTQQNAGRVLPPACPHCHTGGPAWTVDATQGHCLLCGCLYWVAQYTYRPVPGPKRQIRTRWVPALTVAP